MNHETIDGQLALMIDRALEPEGLDESHPETQETIAGLFTAVTEYLARPMPATLRVAALEVAEMSRAETAPEIDEFRSALSNLRSALNAWREEDAAASQIASDPELVQEFLIEARAHLVGVESGILLLEREPENVEALNAVFRSFHTVKGLAGFLGAAAIHELAHETENVLDLARAGKLTLSQEIIELILRSGDELNLCLDRAGSTPMNELPRCSVDLLSALAVQAARDLAPVAAPVVAVVVTEPKAPSSEPNGEPDAHPGGVAANVAAPKKKHSETSVVRIETAKLEYLKDKVGELVIAELRGSGTTPRLCGRPILCYPRNLTQLARVVQEVQKTSMSMRMVAVGSLFRKMSRLTRDLARKSAKQIELVTVGDDVELDRSIVEDLADPMVHMIRNSVDHGLEAPEDRRRAGKPETGTVRLRAMHDAGDIVIEISDDGRGMDAAKILAKARRQGIVGEDRNADEEAIFRLIFGNRSFRRPKQLQISRGAALAWTS